MGLAQSAFYLLPDVTDFQAFRSILLVYTNVVNVSFKAKNSLKNIASCFHFDFKFIYWQEILKL